MELCKVTIDYRKTPKKEYALGELMPAEEFTRQEHTCFVAVHGSFGPHMVAAAAETAIKGVISGDGDAEPYEPFVVSVKYLGGVFVWQDGGRPQ